MAAISQLAAYKTRTAAERVTSRGTCEHGVVTARIERVKACLNAVPLRVAGLGTIPVRAFARLPA
jgi:hypothetical protein